MLISTRGRYALRVMVDLAEHQGQTYVPLKEIASRQEISEKYLEAILKLLVRGQALAGLRGKGGGYRLLRAPQQYTVGEILRLTQEDLSPVACLNPDMPACPRAAQCRTLPMWSKLDLLIRDYLSSITLVDLMAHAEPGNDYII